MRRANVSHVTPGLASTSAAQLGSYAPYYTVCRTATVHHQDASQGASYIVLHHFAPSVMSFRAFRDVRGKHMAVHVPSTRVHRSPICPYDVRAVAVVLSPKKEETEEKKKYAPNHLRYYSDLVNIGQLCLLYIHTVDIKPKLSSYSEYIEHISRLH